MCRISSGKLSRSGMEDETIKAGRDAYRSGTHFDDYPVTGHKADERDAIAILY